MDWHAWLSASRLDPALVYEYAMVLARNELEADDIAYFDHEFLHSMGVSVAKHRLEILKLAWRDRNRNQGGRPKPLSRRLLDRVARYVRSLAHREDSYSSTAMVLVPSQPQYGHRGKALRRAKSEPKGSSTPARQAIGGRGAAAVHAIRDLDGEVVVRWDSLFQDLRPN
jgi:hypothetical protein